MNEPADEVRLLRAAFRACPSIVFVTTERGIVLDATGAAVDFLNVARDTLHGKPLLHFVARGDTKRFRSFVNEGARETITIKLRARHGPVREVRVVVQPESGRLIWLVHAGPVAEAVAGSLPPDA